jgi:hypothetical protein
MNELLKLSWQVQVALGSGYVAYMLAYAGIRQHHQATYMIFRAIGFGLLASLMLYLDSTDYIVWDSLVAFCVAVAGGLVWRYVGISLLRRGLRHFNIS